MSDQSVIGELSLWARDDTPWLIASAMAGDAKSGYLTLALANALSACLQEHEPNSPQRIPPPHACRMCHKLIIREKPEVFWVLEFEQAHEVVAFGLHPACTTGRTLPEIRDAVFAGLNRETVADGNLPMVPINPANIHETGGRA